MEEETRNGRQRTVHPSLAEPIREYGSYPEQEHSARAQASKGSLGLRRTLPAPLFLGRKGRREHRLSPDRHLRRWLLLAWMPCPLHGPRYESCLLGYQAGGERRARLRGRRASPTTRLGCRPCVAARPLRSCGLHLLATWSHSRTSSRPRTDRGLFYGAFRALGHLCLRQRRRPGYGCGGTRFAQTRICSATILGTPPLPSLQHHL